MSDRDFEALRLVAAESSLWRVAAGIARTGLVAWDESRTAGAVRYVAFRFEVLPSEARVRVGALVAAWLGLGHLALVWMMPAYVAPALPRSWFIGFVLSAFATAAAARPLALAWAGSAFASLVRTRT